MRSSSRIAERLKGRIRADGPLPFAAFMEEALYAADGYYASPGGRIGRRGDFVTGSSLSPLFAACTVRLLERLDRPLGRSATILEVGVGTGEHLTEVAKRAFGRRLVGVDRMSSAGIAVAGVASAAGSFERTGTLTEIPERSIDGLVFSYELFDAFPMHRLVGRPDGLHELYVDLSDGDDFRWREDVLSDPELADALGAKLRIGQVADIAPGWRSNYLELAAKLDRGLIVTCDYGFERERLLDSRIRKNGTLACYSRHQVHRDPFVDVGEQDLTAHVDFTTLREAGETAGLETLAFTRQARWLTACGLFEELESADQQTRLDAMHLLDGAGMGDEIRVLVQGRDVEINQVVDSSFL